MHSIPCAHTFNWCTLAPLAHTLLMHWISCMRTHVTEQHIVTILLCLQWSSTRKSDLRPFNSATSLLFYTLLQIKNGISDLVNPKHWINAHVPRSFPACSTIQTNCLSRRNAHIEQLYQKCPGSLAAHTGIKIGPVANTTCQAHDQI